MPGVLMHCMEECRSCWARRGRAYSDILCSEEALHVLLVDYWHRKEMSMVRNLGSMYHQSSIIMYTW